MKKKLNFYISEDLKEWLEEYAEETEESVSAVLRNLIREKREEMKMVNLSEKYSEIWPVLEGFLENISAQEFMEIDDMKDLILKLQDYREKREND